MKDFKEFMKWYNSKGGNLAEFNHTDLTYLYSEYKTQKFFKNEEPLKFDKWCFSYWERNVNKIKL